MQDFSMDPHDLESWVKNRLFTLMEDGGRVKISRGYADYAAGRQPDYGSVVGDPLAADHYHEGYGLAAYELGKATSVQEQVAV